MMRYQALPTATRRRALLVSIYSVLLTTTLMLAQPAHAEEQSTVVALLDQDKAPALKELPSAPEMAPAIDLTAPTDDLWVRIRNGYSMPALDSELVLPQQQWFQNRPDYLRRVVERSRPYLHHIVAELEKRGMPTELALLPMVESSFNPMAYSRAHASGLWQFIPATGKRFDLEQNWWQDQRRDIVASTTAALDYLQTIYDMHGDWHLALASYNWGEGAVKRAIQKNLAKGLPTDFASLNMPAETRNYVPKLLALRNIFGNPRLVAELKLTPLPNRAYFATFEPDKPIDIKIAAKLAEMSVNEFVALNPAHNRPVIRADAQLVIPAEKMEKFQANLENHVAPLSSWQMYTLKSGEKLDKLAPRFGISLSDLKRINGLHGRLKVTAGSSLLVPAKDGNEMSDLPNNLKLPETLPEPQSKAGKGKHKVGGKTRSVGKGKNNKASAKPLRSANKKAAAPVKKTAKPTSKPHKG